MQPATEPLLALLVALLLAAVHLFAGHLRFLDGLPRSRWLSLAGGVSIAYVFLHLLPELGASGEALEPHLGFVEERAYLIALLGLTVFYGLERAALTSRKRAGADRTEPEVFWLHIASFAVYNVIVGYLLLHRETGGLGELLWYGVAMALHFVVNDYGLRTHHKAQYHRWGRWILAGAALLGWALGLALEVSEALLASLFAFLAGGVVLNVLKEELPEERESRFWAFAAGLAGYALLLLAL